MMEYVLFEPSWGKQKKAGRNQFQTTKGITIALKNGPQLREERLKSQKKLEEKHALEVKKNAGGHGGRLEFQSNCFSGQGDMNVTRKKSFSVQI